MKAIQIVKRAEGPAFATDKNGWILSWNEAAKELLGPVVPKQVRGQPLDTILDLRDVFGNRLDLRQMPLYQMVTRGEPIQGFEVSAKRNGGDRVRLLVSVVVVLGPKKAEYEMVYLLRPIFRRRRADEVIERVLANPANGRHVLDRVDGADPKDVPCFTRRQTDVLRLLAQGRSNEEIAKLLFLSVFTVRSHIQSILDKLGVHSKVEAVSRAFRDNLI